MHPSGFILPAQNTTDTYVSDGLVHYVDINDSSSYPGSGANIYDLSASGLDLVMKNYAYDTNAYSAGRIRSNGVNTGTTGTAIKYDAAKNTVFDLNYTGTNAMTFEYWFSFDTWNRLTYDGGAAFGLFFGGSGNYQWQLFKYFTGANARIGFAIRQVYTTIYRTIDLINGDSNFTPNLTITDGSMIQLVFTWDLNGVDDHVHAFINGEDCGGTVSDLGTMTGTYIDPSPSTYADFVLAGNYDYTNMRSLLGYFYLERFYTKALSASEVLQNWNYDKWRFGY